MIGAAQHASRVKFKPEPCWQKQANTHGWAAGKSHGNSRRFWDRIADLGSTFVAPHGESGLS
jgi:hypothetical protein